MFPALASAATTSTSAFLAEVLRLQLELAELEGDLDRLEEEVRGELNRLAREAYEHETSR